MKHVLNRRGSKDISAQLFTALCRALKIPTRLVVSLQSVPWNASAGKSKSPSKAKRGENSKLQSDADDSLENDKEDDSDDEDDDMDAFGLEGAAMRQSRRATNRSMANGGGNVCYNLGLIELGDILIHEIMMTGQDVSRANISFRR